MGNDGYIKVWRRLFNHPIWLNSTPEQKCILIVLMELANHSDNQWEWHGKMFTLKRGQMITSNIKIAEACGKGVSTQNVRTALVRFKKLNFLTYESTNTGKLITIENYSKWQGDGEQHNQQSNKHLTDTQQAPNRHLTTNKNDKNDKNVRNNNIFKPPTVQEVKAYCIQRGNDIDAEHFVDFYASKGWLIGKSKMKDWEAAVRNWEHNNRASKSVQLNDKERLGWIDEI